MTTSLQEEKFNLKTKTGIKRVELKTTMFAFDQPPNLPCASRSSTPPSRATTHSAAKLLQAIVLNRDFAASRKTPSAASYSLHLRLELTTLLLLSC
ncbi:ATP-binding cassette sub-family A member 3-like [Sesbania bispinosa]|nr:ATP-binding cassette sub-family A member 3-like [Sesbania bispinosa]